MSEKQKYCLGYTHEKCDRCANQDKWHELNQLPCALRLKLQHDMLQVPSDLCRMAKMGEFVERS